MKTDQCKFCGTVPASVISGGTVAACNQCRRLAERLVNEREMTRASNDSTALQGVLPGFEDLMKGHN